MMEASVPSSEISSGASSRGLVSIGDVVKANMAFAWYFTVAGAKSEELMLVDEQGASLKSVAPCWPMLEIDYQGSKVLIPDILVR